MLALVGAIMAAPWSQHLTARSACPHLSPTPGPASRRDTLEFCSALMKAHKLGLANSTLLVDVGTDQATEARTARGFGHPVISFECRGAVAQQHSARAWLYNDTGLKLVHSCVGDRAGLASLVRAMDSSSMSVKNVEVQGASWKRRREMRGRLTGTESVPLLPLDAALDAESLAALGWPELVSTRVGFIKIDVQGFEGAVLRGALKTLRTHQPFLYYEDSMLPKAEQQGELLRRLLQQRAGESGSGGGHVRYACECANDCFCRPRGYAARAISQSISI